MKSSLLRRVVVGTSLILASLGAQASSLYGADDGLYSIDPATGASVLIDSGNSAYRLGLAYNGNTNTMYSIGLFDGTLSKVNLSTGATTVVGDNNFQMTGLAFSADYSKLYSLDFNGGPLLSVNPNDGSAVVIGGGNNNMLDLSTNSAGVLYGGGFGGIGTFDVSTGAFSLIGGAFSWTAIAFDENDDLYGIEISSDALYKINPFDGSATLIGGAIGGDVRGMDFAVSGPAVPEPASLALLGLGLAGIGFARRRKQR